MATYHVFKCLKCGALQNRNVTESGSTGAMMRHVSKCWGEDTFNAAKNVSIDVARSLVKKHGGKRNSKLTSFLKRAKNAVESFPLDPPTRAEIRCVLV